MFLVFGDHFVGKRNHMMGLISLVSWTFYMFLENCTINYYRLGLHMVSFIKNFLDFMKELAALQRVFDSFIKSGEILG